MSEQPVDVLARLTQLIASRKDANPASSYVAKLLSKAPDAALKKVGEESAEFIMACKDAEHDANSNANASANAKSRVTSEAADVWFHMLVAMSRYGVTGADVLTELGKREGLSGIDEKAQRQ